MSSRGSEASLDADFGEGSDHRPGWTVGYDLDELVVRAGISGKQHVPNLTADEPAPACGAPEPEGGSFAVGSLNESSPQCHHQKCFGQPDTKQDGGPPQHVLDAAADRRQRSLSRWCK